MEDNHIIEHDDRELYVYGFNQGLNILLNLITTLVVGLLFHNVLELAIFIVAYIPLRSFAGGYHAKTPLRCYIFSIIMLALVSFGMKSSIFKDMVNYVVLTSSAFIIFSLSPVEDKNKPLDEMENRVYKKRTVLILLAELIICISFYMLNLHMVYIPIIYNFAVMSAILILGLLKP